MGSVLCLFLMTGLVYASDNPFVQLRMTDGQWQVSTESSRPYFLEWRTTDGNWRTWSPDMEISAGVKGVWLRGVFQPDDATSWEIPEDAGQLVVPAQADGPSWSPIAEQGADGCVAVIPQASVPEAFEVSPPESGADLPSASLDRANLIWFNPTGRIVYEWILGLSGARQSAFTVTNMSSGAYVPAGMGDVNQDGIGDVFLYDSAQRKVAVWMLTSEGRYHSGIVVNGGTPMSAGWLLRAVGDIDRDGTADIVWHSSTSKKAAYWMLQTNGVLKSYGFCTNLTMSTGWSLNGSGDIDGDGTMDLLWHNTVTKKVAYWFLNSNGTLRSSGFCTTNTMANGWEMRGVGDIKGDGTMAVLWHNSLTKKVAYWFLNTDGTLATSGFSYSGTMTGGWELKATADVNSDGTMDAIWFNTSTRKAACWMMGVGGTVSTSVFCSATAMTSGYTLYAAGRCQPVALGSWTGVAGLPRGTGDAGVGELNGALYFVGGLHDSYDQTCTNVYRFDGTSWTEVKGLPRPHRGHSVCVFNGNLYSIAGGSGGGNVNYVYRFDGTTWVEVAGIPAARMWPASAVLNGYLYSIGGASGSSQTNVYRYDGTSWTETVGLPSGRDQIDAVTMNGSIYVVGGRDSGGSMVTNVFRFNGTNWTQVAGLPQERCSLGLTVFNGSIYAAGGLNNSYSTMSNVYKFSGANWTEVASLPVPAYHASPGVLNGNMYMVGGCYSDGMTNVYRYTP
ncbi:MAG: FG-GAP-like repeat-containing protein [Lentisphaerota bacterium]